MLWGSMGMGASGGCGYAAVECICCYKVCTSLQGSILCHRGLHVGLCSTPRFPALLWGSLYCCRSPCIPVGMPESLWGSVRGYRGLCVAEVGGPWLWRCLHQYRSLYMGLWMGIGVPAWLRRAAYSFGGSVHC